MTLAAPATAQITISPTTLPEAVRGAPYSQQLSASGGTPPYLQYSVTSGGMPAGMFYSASGLIYGTPTATGTTNFTMTVYDSLANTGVRNYALTVVDPPSVSIAVSPASVSEDGSFNLTYTVTRSVNLASATVVNIGTSGSATAGTDYTGNVSTVTIPAGATTATVVIDPVVDATVEADETVVLSVAPGTGYTVGVPSSATGTILNDDVPSATIAVSPAGVAEDGAQNLVYTVTLNQAVASPISVNYTIDGTAANGSDYATIASPLVIPAGSTTGTIIVDPTADASIEADETVILTLATGTGYTPGVPNSATGTILSDELPNLTISDVAAVEGNAGTTNFTFTVSLSTPAGPSGVSFNIATANNTATAGVDYVARSLTSQTIPPGSSTYTFTVQVNGDTQNETNETFFVNVTGVTNAIVVDGQGVGTIGNDDPLPSLSINDVTLVEGNAGTTNATFTVTLSAASGQSVSVNYATANGTATQSADYTATSGTLTFAPGITALSLSVMVAGDAIPEANETFFVNLGGAVNATISDNQGVGTITNDDVQVTVSPATLPNGAVATTYSQTVTASGGTGAYGFAVTSGSLPAGLTLSTAGALSGTPTAGGTFNFTLTATDSSPFPGPFSGSQAYSLTIAAPTITLPTAALPGGTLGAPYGAPIGVASGGTAPYAYAVTAGALPGGLTLNLATGAITGTPSALGTFNFSISATDSSTGTGPYTATRSAAITVVDIAPSTANSLLTVAYNAPATSVPLTLGGGAATSLALVTGPSHGTAVVIGTTITYAPNTGFAGNDSFVYTATNSGGTSAPTTVSITVNDPVVTITPSGSFAAAVASPYTQTFTFNGGAQPWTAYQATNLPAGLAITGTTINTVTISGTPTQAGIFSINVLATDGSTGNGPYTVGQTFPLTVSAPALTMTPAPGTLSAPYGAAFSQTFSAAGGTGPYSYALTGTLPAGMSFSGDTLSGTPTTPGSYPVTVTATDAGSTGTGAPFSIAQNYTINVSAPTIVVDPATLSDPVAGGAYGQSVSATGGVAPYSFAVTAGALPAGISLSTAGALSGSATQVGSFSFTVTATDANGQAGSRAYTFSVSAPALTMTPAPGTLSAPYGAAFSQTFSAAGGTGPYSYALTGTLPAGMSFSGDTLSGTPTAPGSYPVTVTATDAGSTGTGAPFSIAQNYTINVPAPTIVVDPATLPDPVAGGAYAQSVSATGGVAPYSFAVTAGALPAGISLSTAGALSGSATQVGSFSFTVTAADANGQAGSRAYTFSVAAPTLTMTPAPGTLSAPYGAAFSQTFSAAGGTGPYSYALTGTLPAGMSFSGDTLSGTPTAPGSYPITVIATALGLTGVGAPFSIAQNYTINVPAPTIALAPATLPNTTAGLAYSASLSASGGVAPYSFAVTAGALPNGLALASNGTLSGTSISSGIFNFTITATDAFGQTANLAYSVVVAVPTLALTPTTLPAGTSGNAYNQTITVAGGIAPYTVTLSGTLPAGLVFDATSRSFSGTPTQAGSFNVDVTATDSTGGTPATVTTSYTLTIAVPTLTLTPAAGGLPDGIGGVAYQQVFHAGNGVAPYVYAIGGGALPAGLTLDPTTGALNGVPTVAGSFNFSIRATDSTTGTAGTIVQAYALALSAPAIAISPETLPAGMLGAPFDSRLAASGGTAPYQFQLIDGTLPAGVALDADGRLHGTARTSGTFAVTVRAVDALGFSGTRTLNLVISMRPDPSQDADIRGLLEAQIATARRLSDAQANNFRNRMESLHGGAEATGIANRLSLAARPSCLPDLQDASGLRCHGPSDIGASPTPDYSAATDAPAAKANPRPFGAWIGGSIRTGSMDARGRGDGADFETDGISAGVDHRFSPTFAAGLGVGYGRDASRVGDGGARLDARATTFAGYASYHPTGRIYVDALIGYQSLDYRMRREAVNDATLSGQRNGNQWFTSLTLGAEYAPVPDWTLTPYGRYDASRATLDGYSEAGDAVYALRYEAMDVDGRTGSIGLRLDGGIAMHWGTLQPQLRLEYQHDFQSDAFALLQYADGLGPIYRAGLTGFDRNRFMLGMGLLLRVDEGWSTRIEYRGLQGGNSRDHGVNLSVEKGL